MRMLLPIFAMMSLAIAAGLWALDAGRGPIVDPEQVRAHAVAMAIYAGLADVPTTPQVDPTPAPAPGHPPRQPAPPPVKTSPAIQPAKPSPPGVAAPQPFRSAEARPVPLALRDREADEPGLLRRMIERLGKTADRLLTAGERWVGLLGEALDMLWAGIYTAQVVAASLALLTATQIVRAVRELRR